MYLGRGGFRSVNIKYQEMLREILDHILIEKHNNIVEYVSHASVMGDTCLLRSLFLCAYLIKNGYQAYVVIFKPHLSKEYEHHSVVLLPIHGAFLILDPTAYKFPQKFPWQYIVKLDNIDDFEITFGGYIILIFNDKEGYMRELNNWNWERLIGESFALINIYKKTLSPELARMVERKLTETLQLLSDIKEDMNGIDAIKLMLKTYKAFIVGNISRSEILPRELVEKTLKEGEEALKKLYEIRELTDKERDQMLKLLGYFNSLPEEIYERDLREMLQAWSKSMEARLLYWQAFLINVREFSDLEEKGRLYREAARRANDANNKLASLINSIKASYCDYLANKSEVACIQLKEIEKIERKHFNVTPLMGCIMLFSKSGEEIEETERRILRSVKSSDLALIRGVLVLRLISGELNMPHEVIVIIKERFDAHARMLARETMPSWLKPIYRAILESSHDYNTLRNACLKLMDRDQASAGFCEEMARLITKGALKEFLVGQVKPVFQEFVKGVLETSEGERELLERFSLLLADPMILAIWCLISGDFECAQITCNYISKTLIEKHKEKLLMQRLYEELANAIEKKDLKIVTDYVRKIALLYMVGY